MFENNFQQLIKIPVNSVSLEGSLIIPKDSKALVIFVHGSGSSRHSPRNNYVAKVLREAGLATLLFDLLTEEEDIVYETRFNIPFLTKRIKTVTKWLTEQKSTKNLKMG
ncbi:MAG: putative phosphoribosyl transferase, partial [Candidatus Anoxychlamydiales bacterium]|nr:putative phosphoribosyl transferase [Candidatus Anoxychlamydiales bacterium]